MSHLNIDLAPDLQHWAEARASRAGYSSVSDYLTDLVRRDQMAIEEDIRRVRALVEEGLASGVVDREPEEIIEEIIAGIRQRNG